MIVNDVIQKDSNLRRLLEGVRVGLFLVILTITVIGDLFQPAFINWGLLAPFYSLIAVAMAHHLILVSFMDSAYARSRWLFFSFLVDALLISCLIHLSGLNQSLFLFLHLINILIAGVIFRSEGGLIVALSTSVFFTIAVALGPDIKAMQFLFLLTLNNIAFFLIAGLSGYLSEQLQNVGAELQKTGLSLRSAQELNRLIIENIPSGLMTFDVTGRILQRNDAARTILGKEEILGTNVYDLLKGMEPREVSASARFDMKYADPLTGGQKILGVVASAFESPDLGGWVRVALLEDLTKIRFLEQSVRQAEKMAAVGQLAAGIAHEIRNPLSGISGSVELLSQSVPNEDDQRLMKIILREIDRLNLLITEFLDYARPEVPPVDPVDLVPLIQEVVDSVLLSKAARKEAQIVRRMGSTAVIAAHRDKLKQAFLNMMINAHQAMENTLRPVLEVSVQQEDGQVVVVIKDNGCGMKEGTLKRMFEPFHTTKPKGTGLGLAITHKILEAHRAQIFVESEEGRGTEFKLVFPALGLRT